LIFVVQRKRERRRRRYPWRLCGRPIYSATTIAIPIRFVAIIVIVVVDIA